MISSISRSALLSRFAQCGACYSAPNICSSLPRWQLPFRAGQWQMMGTLMDVSGYLLARNSKVKRKTRLTRNPAAPDAYKPRLVEDTRPRYGLGGGGSRRKA